MTGAVTSHTPRVGSPDLRFSMTPRVPFSSLSGDFESEIGANSENRAPFRSPLAPSCDDSLESDKGMRACAECGAGFTSPYPRQRFCTELCKDRQGHRRRYGAQPHELVCRQCRRTWTRPAQTGRLPHSCPDCRGTAPHVHPSTQPQGEMT